MSKPRLILIGAGGHAKACIDVIEQHGGYQIAGLVGRPNEMHAQHLGYAVIATDNDLATAEKNEQTTEAAFPGWIERCGKWKLQLELIDLEMTLDSRLILYVLNDRGAETTRMALLAAAAGLGIVHVQPVSAEGVVQASGGGGCGSCSNH